MEVWRACLVGHNVVVVAIGHDEAHVEQCLLEAGDERSASTPKHAAGVALKDTNGAERGLGAARGSPPVIGEVGGVVGAVDATDELTIFAISKRGLGRGRKGAERSYEGGQHQVCGAHVPSSPGAWSHLRRLWRRGGWGRRRGAPHIEEKDVPGDRVVS